MTARGWTGIALILAIVLGAMLTVAAKKGWAQATILAVA